MLLPPRCGRNQQQPFCCPISTKPTDIYGTFHIIETVMGILLSAPARVRKLSNTWWSNKPATHDRPHLRPYIESIGEQERCDPSARDQLEAFNNYNRRIMHYLREQALTGKGVLISMTDCYRHSDYGVPIAALKSYMLSPFIDEQHVERLVSDILAALDKFGTG